MEQHFLSVSTELWRISYKNDRGVAMTSNSSPLRDRNKQWCNAPHSTLTVSAVFDSRTSKHDKGPDDLGSGMSSLTHLAWDSHILTVSHALTPGYWILTHFPQHAQDDQNMLYSGWNRTKLHNIVPILPKFPRGNIPPNPPSVVFFTLGQKSHANLNTKVDMPVFSR